MLLNSLEKLQGITDITPHAYPQEPFMTGTISQEVVDSLVSFTLDICQEIEKMAENGVNPEVEDFAQYTERFKQIREEMKANATKKKTPEEYVECVYVITYQFVKLLGKSQEFVSKVLDFKKSNYKSYWGMSPAADFVAYNSEYQFKLPIDKDTDFLEAVIPYIGKKSSIVSNDYFIGVSNRMSILANLKNTNKNATRKNKETKAVEFYGRQFYFNIADRESSLRYIFIAHTKRISRDNTGKYAGEPTDRFRDMVKDFINTDDIKITEDLMEYLLNNGVQIKPENLNNNNFVAFQVDYEKYKKAYEERKYWIEAKDSPEHDYDDAFLVDKEEHEAGRDIDKVAVCEANIASLTNEIDALCEKLIDALNLSTFTSKNNIGVLKFLIEKYQEEMETILPSDIKDEDEFCTKYFIARYFDNVGVSNKSIEEFKKYLDSKEFGVYTDKYENDYISAMYQGIDIDNRPFKDILTELREEMLRKDSNKENRAVTNALVYIDTEYFEVTDKILSPLLDVYENIYFIISSEEKLKLGGMSEEYIRTRSREIYLYTNI